MPVTPIGIGHWLGEQVCVVLSKVNLFGVICRRNLINWNRSVEHILGYGRGWRIE